MTSGKDSAEVVEFMTLFAGLKEACNDDVGSLPGLAEQDKTVKDLCDRLSWAAHALRMNERRRRELFATPVDPGFLFSWRDFENRFERIVTDIWLADLFQMLDEDLDGVDRHQVPQADVQWQIADSDADEQSHAIEAGIDFAFQQATDDTREFPRGFRERIEEGTAAWERLKSDAGFDLRGVFRRRELVPFILVPRHVAEKHGSAEMLSMLKSLQQAHDAFVFGVPFAAVALMRSILESVLRDHYGAQGKNLDERIRSVSSHLPRGASEAALHRLRRLANAILHLDTGKAEGLPKIDSTKLEKEIVSLLLVLRALIEGAPQRRAR
jgi:hypothetical protein